MRGDFNIKNKAIYIPQIDGKDIWISNNFINEKQEYSTYDKNNRMNLKRYKATFDNSLDLIKLKEIFKENNGKDLWIKINKKLYSDLIVNVTFEYSVKEYNRTNKNTYIKFGYSLDKNDIKDGVFIKDNVLIAINTDVEINNLVSEDVLGNNFYIEENKYKANSNIKTIASVADIRDGLYNKGFYLNGKKFIRWKRSSGSARVGKCLFLEQSLYKNIKDWEMCGLKIEENDEVDLAGLESYISLTSSSIIDTIKIKPENILVINDYESIFEEDVISVEEKEEKLIAEEKRVKIFNSIWDGESLIDKSLMGKYSAKGMVLLRNRFFKSCCFNSNIQEWFADNNITDISQLNGFTIANDIKDIKLITTPNSIKYLKFSSIEKWMELLEDSFGVVKYEKPTPFMEGKMVQSHYQLINTIQLSKVEMNRLLKPTFDIMTKLKNDPDILKYWINYNIEDELEITSAKSKTDVIYKMMSVNNDFCKTKLYYDFKTDYLKSFTKNLKSGHVLIEGNYSTMCGNPIEMLKSAIGKFDHNSCIEENSVCSTRFNWDEDLIISRSPHITMSNVLLTGNKYNKCIDKYMNATDEIIYINSINHNILHRLSGCDFDGDTALVSNNKTLINAAAKHNSQFKVAVCNVEGTKVKRKYCSKDQSDLDIKTSRNLIGEIINLSQELNTLIWDMIYKGHPIEDTLDIYRDACILSIMSGIEIDKAKKEFTVDNAKELSIIRKKYRFYENGKSIKPKFFAHIARQKGYYNSTKNTYKKHHTSMDYLQESVNSFRLKKEGKPKKNNFLKFSEVISQDSFNYDNVNDKQVSLVVNKIIKTNSQISAIYSDTIKTNQDKFIETNTIRQNTVNEINNIKFNDDTMIALLKTIDKEENKKYRRLIFYMLFGYPNTSFYNVIKKSQKKLFILERNTKGNIEIFGDFFIKK